MRLPWFSQSCHNSVRLVDEAPWGRDCLLHARLPLLL
jgi:hypothetical protein